MAYHLFEDLVDDGGLTHGEVDEVRVGQAVGLGGGRLHPLAQDDLDEARVILLRGVGVECLQLGTRTQEVRNPRVVALDDVKLVHVLFQFLVEVV